MKLTPLNTMREPATWPPTAVGTKPRPVSIETTASRVRLLVSIRLVTLTGKYRARLSEIAAPD